MNTIYDMIQNHAQLQHDLGIGISLYLQIGHDYFFIRSESATLLVVIKMTYSMKKSEGHHILLLSSQYTWFTGNLKNIDTYIGHHDQCVIVDRQDMCTDFTHRVMPNIRKMDYLASINAFNFLGYPCTGLFIITNTDDIYMALHVVDMTDAVPRSP